MKVSLLFYISLTFSLISLTQCNGLMRKLSSESQLSLTCRKTSNFGFCAYTLGTDPRSKGAGVEGLAQIALNMLNAHVRETTKYLDTLKGTVARKEAQAVASCSQFYGIVGSKDVSLAVESLNDKAYGKAKQAAQAAVNGGERCQTGLDSNPSPKLQMLSIKNKYTLDLSQLSSELIALLG